VLAVANWSSGFNRQNDRTIRNAIPSFGDFAGIVAFWRSGLNNNPVDVLRHW
jgi:hypothetical protein